jgi:hypothetical protein
MPAPVTARAHGLSPVSPTAIGSCRPAVAGSDEPTTEAGTQRQMRISYGQAGHGSIGRGDAAERKGTYRAGEGSYMSSLPTPAGSRRAWHLLMSRVVPWTVPGLLSLFGVLHRSTYKKMHVSITL